MNNIINFVNGTKLRIKELAIPDPYKTLRVMTLNICLERFRKPIKDDNDKIVPTNQ